MSPRAPSAKPSPATTARISPPSPPSSTDPELQLAPFKGVKQQYRPWDGQFRQPILIATDKVPVSISPQAGFPHASHAEIEMDTLGIDEPDSLCKM